jgi:hypothetical protein
MNKMKIHLLIILNVLILSLVKSFLTDTSMSFYDIYSYTTNCQYGRINFLSNSIFSFTHIESGGSSDMFTIYAYDTTPTLLNSLQDSTIPLTGDNLVNSLYIGNNKLISFHTSNTLKVYTYSNGFALTFTKTGYFGANNKIFQAVDSAILPAGTSNFYSVLAWELV